MGSQQRDFPTWFCTGTGSMLMVCYDLDPNLQPDCLPLTCPETHTHTGDKQTRAETDPRMVSMRFLHVQIGMVQALGGPVDCIWDALAIEVPCNEKQRVDTDCHCRHMLSNALSNAWKSCRT